MPSSIGGTMSAREWSLLLILSGLWGGSFFFVGVAVRELPPLTIVVIRLVLGALLIYAILRIGGGRMPRAPGLWRTFFMMGFLNNVIPFTLMVWGQTQIASGLAAIINATTPLFAILVAHIGTEDEKLSGRKMLAVAVGFGGVVVMIGPDLLGGVGGATLAQLACLASAFMFAVGSVYGRRFRSLGIRPAAAAVGQMSTSCALLIPLMLLIEQPWTLPLPGIDVIAAVLALGLVSSAFGNLIFFQILGSAGATNILLVTLLIPVWSVSLGTLVLNERLDWDHFAGMAMIALGLVVMDGRLIRWVRRAV